MAVMYRYAKERRIDVSANEDALAAFSDIGALSESSHDAARWAVTAGLFGENDGKLRPQDTAIRAELAVLLQRLIKLEQADL